MTIRQFFIRWTPHTVDKPLAHQERLSAAVAHRCAGIARRAGAGSVADAILTWYPPPTAG